MSISCHYCHHHHHCHHHHCHRLSVCECNCISCPVHSLSSSVNHGQSMYKSASSYDIFKQSNGFKKIMDYNSFNVNSNNSTCNTFDDMNNFRGMSSQGFDLQRNGIKGNDELERNYMKQLQQEPQMKKQLLQNEYQQQMPLWQEGNENDYKDLLSDSLKLLKTINDVSGKGNDIKNVDYYIKHKPEFKNEIKDDINWVNSLIGNKNKELIHNDINQNYKESDLNKMMKPKLNENINNNNNNNSNVYPNNTNLKMLDDKLKNKRFDIGNDFTNPNRGIAGVTNQYPYNNNNNLHMNKDINTFPLNNNNNNTNGFNNEEALSNSNQFKQIKNNPLTNNELNLPFNKNEKLKSKKRELEYPNNQQIIKDHQNNPLYNEDFTLRQAKSDNNNNIKSGNHNQNNMIYQTPQFGETNIMGYQLDKDKFPKNNSQFDFTMKNSKIKPPDDQYIHSQVKLPQQQQPSSSYQPNNTNLHLMKNPLNKAIIPGDSYNQRQKQFKQSQNNNIPINPRQPIPNSKPYINNNNNNNLPYNNSTDKEFPQQNQNIIIPNKQQQQQDTPAIKPYYNMLPNNPNQKLSFKEQSVYRSNSNSPNQKYINPNYKHHKVLKKNNSTVDGNKMSPYYNDNNFSKTKMNSHIINRKLESRQIDSISPMQNAYVTKTKPKSKKEYYYPVNNSFSGNCFACEVGCNVSNTGYSPMTFSPYNPNIRRRSVTPLKGDLNN